MLLAFSQTKYLIVSQNVTRFSQTKDFIVSQNSFVMCIISRASSRENQSFAYPKLQLISVFVSGTRVEQPTIFLNPKFHASSLLLQDMTLQADLCRTRSETQKTVFFFALRLNIGRW